MCWWSRHHCLYACSKCTLSLRFTNNDGNTPLHLACAEGRESIAHMLVTKFASSLLVKNNNGDTALHVACANGHSSIARMLIVHILARKVKNEADLMIKNNDGNTPLHLACAEGHESVAHMLVAEFHSDLTISNNEGKSPRDLLICRGLNNSIAMTLISESFAQDNTKADNELTKADEIKSVIPKLSSVEIKKMNSDELKYFLSERSLSTQGPKKDLIKRLIDYEAKSAL